MGPADSLISLRRNTHLLCGLASHFTWIKAQDHSRYTEGHHEAGGTQSLPCPPSSPYSAAHRVSYFLQILSVKGSASRVRAELTPLHRCRDQQGLGTHKVPLYFSCSPIW